MRKGVPLHTTGQLLKGRKYAHFIQLYISNISYVTCPKPGTQTVLGWINERTKSVNQSWFFLIQKRLWKFLLHQYLSPHSPQCPLALDKCGQPSQIAHLQFEMLESTWPAPHFQTTFLSLFIYESPNTEKFPCKPEVNHTVGDFPNSSSPRVLAGPWQSPSVGNGIPECSLQ